MSVIVLAVLGLCWIVSVVCWIIVVIRMFGQGILTGILGIICSLYAMIWGFLNKDVQGLGAVMLAWVLSTLVSVGITIAYMSTMRAAAGAVPVP